MGMALVAGLAVALVVLPIARLVQVVAQESDGRLDQMLSSPGLGTAVGNTVGLATAVTVLSLPLGIVLALALRRPDLPARRFWQLAMLLPVLVPEFVLAYSWAQAYGRAGFTEALLGLGWPGVLGPAGVVVVMVVSSVPLAYLVVAVGLAARAEPNLERAARASGATALTVLRTVTLPLLRPAIAAAGLLVFVLTLGSFAVPQVMGAPAGFTTITTRIYGNLTLAGDAYSFVEAVALALLLVVFAAAVIAPADALLGPRIRAERVAGGEGAPVESAGRATSFWAAAGIGCYLILAVGLPMLGLLATAITRAVGVPPSLGNWTLDNFAPVLDQRTFEALGRSLWLALLAATLLTVLGAGVAVLERRRAGRGLATVVTLTVVLPGSTLAVALLLTYGRWLAGTLTLILLAYLAKLWAFAHRPISGALDRLPPDELHAARASGAGLVTAIRTVALRPMAPALLAGWLVCFVTALHEVTMSSLLYGPGSETLAVVVLNTSELGQIGPTAALSVLMTLVVAVPALPLWLALRRLRAWEPTHVG